MRYVLFVFFILSLSACAGDDVKYDYPEKVRGRYQTASRKQDTVFDEGGFFSSKKPLFSWGKDSKEPETNINADLWKAALETLKFMPLASVDSNSGVLITDWYSPESTPFERVKVTAMVTSKTLRADGVSVTVFKQTKNESGDWVDVKASNTVALKLENAILSKAREMRAAKTQ